MEVFIVQGIHFDCPPNKMSAHATIDLANAKAAELLKVIVNDCNDSYDWEMALVIVPENWERMQKMVHERFVTEGKARNIEEAERTTAVWIDRLDVETVIGVEMKKELAAHDLHSRARIAGVRDIDQWTEATMTKFLHENGVTPPPGARMNWLRKMIIDSMGDWVKFCSDRGISISDPPQPPVVG